MPGTNPPNEAAGPSVSDSVAGPVPETSPSAGTPTLIASASTFAQPCPCAMYFGVLVSTSAAVADTFTLNLMGGAAAGGGSVSVRRQVRVPPPVQAQPGASIDVTVSPGGIASVTVTVEPPTGSGSLGVSSRFGTVTAREPPRPPPGAGWRGGASGWVPVTDSEPPRPRASGVCVASIPSPSGATNHCAGGVPGRSRKLYGTGLVICGIGAPEDT